MLTLLSAVSVVKQVTTPDGMGGVSTTTTTITTLARAQTWQSNSFNRFLSDKVTKDSTHVLAFVTGAYDFADTDVQVTHGSLIYKPVGHPTDVANQGLVSIIGLERLT
jgi:hypothetical protein